MTNQQVARAFAEGKETGKSLHMFIEGDTVYSYGKHFPIARRVGEKKVNFTNEKNSSSTNRQKSLVLQELNKAGIEVIPVDMF